MQKLKILNTRDIKRLKETLRKEFGYALQEGYVYLQNDKNRVFLVNKDMARINLNNLRIDRFGLYFAEYKNNQARLSKEGAQLLVKEARQNHEDLNNLVDLDQKETKDYFQGHDLEKDLGDEPKLIILQHKDNILGCAKYKEGKILNFLSKIHRGEVIL